MATVLCVRCGLERDSMAFQPFPNDLGRRVYEQVCGVCWGEWLRTQQQLINHYGLNVMDPQARQFLTQNMKAFLFRSGQEESIDTSKKGTINY